MWSTGGALTTPNTRQQGPRNSQAPVSLRWSKVMRPLLPWGCNFSCCSLVCCPFHTNDLFSLAGLAGCSRTGRGSACRGQMARSGTTARGKLATLRSPSLSSIGTCAGGVSVVVVVARVFSLLDSRYTSKYTSRCDDICTWLTTPTA